MQIAKWGCWRIAAAFGLFGSVAGGVISFTVPKSYTSTAILRSQPPVSSRVGSDRVRQLSALALSRSSLTQIIEQEKLYPALRAEEPLEDVIAKMRRDIRMENSGADTFLIAFAYGDPAKAQRTTQVLTERLVDAEFAVVDPPSMPANQTNQNLSRLIGTGLGVGILVGFVLWLFMTRTRIALLQTAFGLAGALVGVVVAYALPLRYSSIATIRAWMGEEPMSDSDIQKRIEESISREYLVGVAGKHRGKRENMASDELIQKLRRDMTFDHQRPGVFTVAFTHEDPSTAQRTNAELVGRVMSQPLVNPSRDAVQPSLEVLEPANVPVSPVNDYFWIVTGFGASIGLILGQRKTVQAMISR
jgi:hypothetical protein